MSATCTFCGGNLAPGVLHDPKHCAPVPEGLDFKKARDDVRERHHKRLVEMPNPDALVFFESEYRAALNAQVAERIAAARQEAVADLLGKDSPNEMLKALDKWVALREDVEDCTCELDVMGCWHRLSDDQQRERRVKSLLEWLNDRKEAR